jgi:hypothetical protein
MQPRTFQFGAPPAARAQSRRGNALIGILIVVAIILILMTLFSSSGSVKSAQQEVAQVQYIDRSAEVTCNSNIRAFETDMMQMRIANDGRLPAKEEIQRRFFSKRCPRGGAIVVGKDGKIYCTKHSPPPIDQLKDMMTLFDAAPEETPVPPPPEVTPMH